MSNKVSKKGSGAKKNDGAALITEIISKMTSVYVLLLFSVFPLFATDKYYNVLRDKYYFFFYSTIAVLVIAVLVIAVGFMGGLLKGEAGERFIDKLTDITITDKFFMAFFACAFISTFTSEWIYESFWGNVGRLQGLFFFAICYICYYLITRFFTFKPFYLYVLLAVGTLTCLWGITDYLGLDILGWRADAQDYIGMLVFTSSYGNVNTATEVFAVFAGLAAVLSVGHEKPWIFYVSALICFMGMITGFSDNAFLAVCGIMGLLPFWCFNDRKGVIRYLILCAVLLLSMALTGWLTSVWTKTPVLPEWHWGVLLVLANKHAGLCLLAAVSVSGLAALLYLIWKKDTDAQAPFLKRAWYFIFAATVLFVIFAFIDANAGKHAGLWEPLSGFLIFNDRWGTNRGFAWRKAWEFFKDFSIIKKLFGTGPETYAIFMAKYCYYEMIDFMDAIFDSPHSEPIQYFFTTGVFGGICYYATIISGVARGFKRNLWSAAFAFAVIGYTFASIIDISVPIATPYLIFSLALSVSAQYGDNKEV